MILKTQLTKRAAVLMLCASMLLTASASALFGGREKRAEPEAGAPIARDLAVKTYQGIPYQAQLLASDLEGGELTCAVEKPPRKGSVTIEGTDFTYTPDKGASGTDSFTYTAADGEGHTSEPAKVTVKIAKIRSGVSYADMENSAAAAAAQELAEAGIFVGPKIGGQYCFEPDRTVSRNEFLAMVMETAGRTVTDVTMTGFCDDAAIPTWAKAYASAGAADGVVRGSATDQGPAFRGEDAITLNEAATVLNRLLDVGDVELAVWYADRDSVPSWAAQAVGNMESVSVLSAGSFGSSAMDAPITRADAAQMLSAVKILLET